MILLKLFYFLKGYVIIDIIDAKTEQLLQIAAEYHIRLWNISPSSAYCSTRDVKRLLDICEAEGVSVKIAKECSLLLFLKKGAGGIMLFSAAMALLFVISAGYVWEIEVNGCNSDTAAKVLEILEEQGLRVGVKKSTLPNGKVLRDSIIYNIDGVHWAWVNLDGTLARVEVSYSPMHEPQPDENEPCNVAAAVDGRIVSVSAWSGRKCAAVGQTVSAGEILISGAMPGGTLTEPYMLSADGEVLAETVHTEACSIPLVKTYESDMGEVFLRKSLRIFDLEIPLGFKKAPDFGQYRVEKHTPPLGICTYRYIATESVSEPISIEAAVAEAKDILSERIAHSLSGAARKLDEELVYTQINGYVKVTLTMRFIENIGTKTPIEAWQMEELTNDKTN